MITHRPSKISLVFLGGAFVALLLIMNTAFEMDVVSGFDSLSECSQQSDAGTHGLPQLIPPSIVNDDSLHRVWTQVTFSVDFEKELVSHKMQYLQDLGLDMTYALIIIHQQNTNTELQQVIDTVTSYGVPLSQIHTWDGVFTVYKKLEQRLMTRKKAGVDECDWVINLDGDEFPRAPENDMISFLESLGSQGFDAASASWLDRFGPKGTFPHVLHDPGLSKQFPVGCSSFSFVAAQARDTKLFAFRGFLEEGEGGSHTMLNQSFSCPYPIPVIMDHFKWNKKALEKLKRRKHQYYELGIGWWQESSVILEHIQSHNGSIDMDNSTFHCLNLENATGLPVLDTRYFEGFKWYPEEHSCGAPHRVCSSKLQRLVN